MDKYQNLPFHPTMEKLVNILRKKTQNEDPVFFRLVVSYFFSKMASMMRVRLELGDDQIIPVNMYGINLAPSGSGKGHSINIIENEVINAFHDRFMNETFPKEADKHLLTLANRRAVRDGTDADDELTRAEGEFEELGTLLFSFDSGTTPALKQMRTKLLMAKAGSMNFESDEIGSNLTGNMEILTAFLELYDTGKIKQKLVKNTRDNQRAEDLVGSTPTNMLLFGTPSKLLNGSKTEDEFYEMLEIGYARRCFFGFSRHRRANKNQTPEDMYDLYHDPVTSKYLATLSDRFGQLAAPTNFHQTLRMKKDVLLALYAYRIACQEAADTLFEYDDVRKAEITHRYFKVAKLAGVYAFIDKSVWIKQAHLDNAIAMAEETGAALQNILSRDRPYVKLANYICGSGKELTQADLTEDLPFYKGTEAAKREMLSLATAHGYKQGMYIRSDTIDGIQFLSGKRVPETNLDAVLVSYSKDYTEGYRSNEIPFSKIHNLLMKDDFHWVTHKLKDGYRNEENCIPGANLIVLDVEKSVDIKTAQYLLKDYTWAMHTTKRHTQNAHRYRIVMPVSHHIDLDAREFKEFMANVFDWLPFEVDTQTGQRSRKWLTCNGNYWYNYGELLDTLQFVPKTKKADERRALVATQTNLDALERWSINQMETGNRNHSLARYAFTLVELGHDENSIRSRVMDLNSKLPNPLDDAEILSTIMRTVTKRIHSKED